jgi:hypothetical protein
LERLALVAFSLNLALGACGGGDEMKAATACDPNDSMSCAQGSVCKPRTDDAMQFECVPGCLPEDAKSCANDLVCEQLGTGDRYECLTPLLVSGRVFGALDGVGLENATVVGLDPNGAARTRVARTQSDGSYELPISIKRNEDGSPVEEAITLRVAAADHQPFPLAPRAALPIQLGTATSMKVSQRTVYRVQNAATDVALIPLPESQRGGVTVSGVVSTNPAGGVLVLAVVGNQAQSTAVSDSDGEFVLFNVTPGQLTLEGYRAGIAIAPQTVTAPATGLTDVQLSAATAQLATVSGNISIVNASGGLTTSVILAVASTFDSSTARAEAPAGLRMSNVTGAFEIANVPPGRYAVLAAFENDLLVRDPDQGIAGTDIVFIDVGSAGSPVALAQTFKVTGALAVISPGAQDVEEMPLGTINLTWADDSSENGYELRVYDALGTVVHEDNMIPSVTGSNKVQYALEAGSFEPGMLYQFRVWSWKMKARQTARTYISASEDLRGAFKIKR